jgi:hypothetical protein
LALAGFSRYRKRRKNLTAALAIVSFLMLFFINLFSVLDSNLARYWAERGLPGDLVLSDAESQAGIMQPVDPDHYFSPADFYSRNPRLIGSSSARLRIGAMGASMEANGDFDTMFVLVGIDGTEEGKLPKGVEIEEGGPFSGETGELVLPRFIMNSLGVSLGDSVVLAARSSAGFLSMEAAKVVGVMKEDYAGAMVFGNYLGYAPLALVQDLSGEAVASEILVKPGSVTPLAPLKGPYRLFPALSTFGIARAVSMAYRFLEWIVLAFLGVFAFAVVYQNVSLMNEERRGEIAVYLAYGAAP